MKKNFAIFGLVVLTLGGGMAFSQDVTPPVISNVSANPNPFTPNGDGNDETTTISFSLSEGAFVTINIAGTNYVDNIFYPTGPNQWVWDGDTLGDNNYLYQISAVDTIGNESDTVDNNVILNRDAPIIENIFAAPNPFSPNGDGTKDYFFVEFDVRRSSPDVYDTLFSPDTLTGILTVWRDSVGVKSVFNPVSKPPVYDYYIYVFPTVRFNSPVTITFFGMVGDVSVTIPANTRRIYRVGGLVDRFDESYYPPIVSVEGVADVDSGDIYIYSFTGNARVKFYDDQGNEFANRDLVGTFIGDNFDRFGQRSIENYGVYLGPTGVPDGLYSWEIAVEDEAFLVWKETGQFVADSYPLQLQNIQVQPYSTISPADSNDRFDATNITYNISEPAQVTVRLYRSPPFDTTTLVRTLLNQAPQDSGDNFLIFDGKDSNGAYLSVNAESTYFFTVFAYDPLGQVSQQGSSQVRIDNLGPSAPSLATLPTPTNQPIVEVAGTGEPRTLVTLFQNNQPFGIQVADSLTGTFSFSNVTLAEGLNEFFAISEDEVANFGDTSNAVTVFLDRGDPRRTLTFPGDGVALNTVPLPYVYITARDDETGVNFANSTIRVPQRPGSASFVSPDTFYYYFNDSLGVGDDGVYIIEVVLRDSVGNVDSSSTYFLYDTQIPNISVAPADSDTVNLLLSISSIITDNLAGLDSSASNILLIKLPADTIPGFKEGADSVLTFTPDPPLRTDGSDDGRYAVEVMAVDKAKNSNTSQTTLLYDSKAPLILSMYPEDSAYVNTPLKVAWVVLSDSVTLIEYSGVNFSASRIKVDNLPGGKSVSGDTIFLTLNDSLTANGEHAIEIFVIDRAGNDSTLYTVFTLDTRSPYVKRAVPGDGEFVNQPVSTVRAILGDYSGSGINFDTTATSLTLYSPWPVAIPGDLSNDGDSTLTFDLDNPLREGGTDDGRYTLVIWGEDNIGQPIAPANPETTYFVYDTRPPVIDSTVPDSGAISVVLRDSVYAYVSDLFSGVPYVSGIDFRASEFWLEGPEGGIPGQYFYVNQGDTVGVLKWRFYSGVELPTGIYTMKVHLVDRAGNIRDKEITFQGGALLPEAGPFTPPQGAFVNFVDRVSVLFIDNSGTGIDTVRSNLTLQDPNNILIPEIGLSWGGDTLTLFIDPLSMTVNGIYTMMAYPYSNDTLIPPGKVFQSTFFYDTQLPVISSYDPATGDTIDTLDPIPSYVQANVIDPLAITMSGFGTVEFREDHSSPTLLLNLPGSGIDFERSIIGLISPSGSMAGNKSHDGASYLRYTPSPPGFIEDGIYTITVELYDWAGNVYFGNSNFYLFAGLQLSPLVGNITPADGDTVTYILSNVSARLNFSTADSSTIRLDSAGTVVPGTQTNFGDSLIVYTLNSEPLPGQYRITAIARRTGVAEADTEYATFLYDPPDPRVVSTIPANGSTDTTVINSVFARLQNSDGDSSTITLKDSTGATVLGTQYTFGDTLLEYRLSNSLSQRGEYSIITVAQRGRLEASPDTSIFQYNPPDIIPPPLTVNPLPDSTSEQMITASGSAEVNAKVYLSVTGVATFSDSVNTDSLLPTFSFVDVPLDSIGMYIFTFRARDQAGNLSVPVADTVYRILPQSFKVYIALPFNQESYQFSIDLPQPAEELNIAVYNTGGDFIWGDSKTNLPVGLNRISWVKNGRFLVNNSGDEVQNGLYIYVVNARMAGKEEKVKKLLMVLR